MKTYFQILILIIAVSFFSCKKEIIIKENQKVSKLDYENEISSIMFKFLDNSFAGQIELSKNKKTESGMYALFNDGEISQYKIGL